MAKSTKKTTKKIVVKKAPAKKVRIVVKKPDISKVKDINFKPIGKVIGLILIIVSAFALIDLAVQYLNNDYSVAVVDGTRISKSKWHKTLESAYGSSVAQQLIDEQIIRAEAKKADITVSKEEIDKQITDIETSLGGKEALDTALVANNITLEQLKEQVELDILSTKILTPQIEYTEDDVKSFFNQYSDVIFPDETAALEKGEKLDFDKYKEETEKVYIQQQVQSKRSSWLTEVEGSHRIQDNSVSRPRYGFLTTTVNIINNLLESSKKAE